MAHFARIDENNIVTDVIVVSNTDAVSGVEFINSVLGLSGTWMQTSYNSIAGVHYDERRQPTSKPHMRYNFAGKGHVYDSTLDAFIPPKPYPSWQFNRATCTWVAPVPYPTDVGYRTTQNQKYVWDESTVSYKLIDLSNTNTTKYYPVSAAPLPPPS